MNFKAIIALADGTTFTGEGFGKPLTSIGEIVFNTSMTGYQEIITDPSYKSQIITFTHPHIGNTGINNEDNESEHIHASGVIVNHLCKKPSNWRSKKTLDIFLEENDCIGISEVNTRLITEIIRDKGSMGCCIASLDEINVNEAIQLAKNFSGLNGVDLAKIVSTKKSYKWTEGVWPKYSNSNSNTFIAAYDYGIKTNILRLIAENIGTVKVFNAETPIEEIMDLNPKGIFLSNGPGDPEPCDYAIKNIKTALKLEIPIFGICLGHQLLSLAAGAKTFKMKFGHHGANHPVQNLISKEVFITSQNHGFAVDIDSLPSNIKKTHLSLFDGTLQGIELTDKPAFSFQGHPEASPGPQEIQLLFKKFKNMVDKYAKKV